jgi:carbon monoxide dehydrogenase subunit G
MDMQGSRHLAVSQQQAWDALNDPQVLKVCIPGCDKVEPAGENQYAIGMAVKVGPVAAKFAGRIQLLDVVAPNSYTLSFEGNGGVAGFGKGNAKVNLAPPAEGGGCELTYTAHAQVGGKIAQVGQRLVDGVARSMAEDFFRRFDEEMQRRHPEAYAAAAAADTALPVSPIGEATGTRMPLWVWIVFGVVVLVALLMLAR